MKKYKFPLLPGLLLSCLFIACSDDNKEDLPDLQPGEGMNYSPKTPDADQPLTITFKAPTSSALFGYKGSIYPHRRSGRRRLAVCPGRMEPEHR